MEPTNLPREQANSAADSESETAIRQLIADWGAAVQSRDIERIMAFYAPGVVAYDLPPPLQFDGADAYRKDWETYLPRNEDSIFFKKRPPFYSRHHGQP